MLCLILHSVLYLLPLQILLVNSKSLHLCLLVTSHCSFLLLLIRMSCVFIAPTPEWYTSLSLLDYSPVIKELSPQSKLTLLYSPLCCWHWASVITFLLRSLLAGKSCHREALEGDYEQSWRGNGTCSSCLLPVCFIELPVPVSITHGILLRPSSRMHIQVFLTLGGPTLSGILRDTSTRQALLPPPRYEFQLYLVFVLL